MYRGLTKNMSRKHFAYLAALAVAVLAMVALGGCSDDTATAGPKTTFDGEYPINVMCTTGMVADVVRNVGGGHIQVGQLMGADVDPHLYDPDVNDARTLRDADLVFYSGLHLEGKMTEIFESIASRHPTVAVGEAVDPTRLINVAEGQPDAGVVDPHIWFDVPLWSQTIDAVTDTLCSFDATHAEEYRLAADAYRAQLVELDEYCRNTIAKIPDERRVLVTSHDAFQYFGRAYGIEVRAIQGISTETEAGLFEVNDLVEFLVERKITAVFTETSVANRNIQSLVEGCRAKGHDVTTGGELYSDALGGPGTGADTYIGMLRHNADTIARALQ